MTTRVVVYHFPILIISECQIPSTQNNFKLSNVSPRRNGVPTAWSVLVTLPTISKMRKRANEWHSHRNLKKKHQTEMSVCDSEIGKMFARIRKRNEEKPKEEPPERELKIYIFNWLAQQVLIEPFDSIRWMLLMYMYIVTYIAEEPPVKKVKLDDVESPAPENKPKSKKTSAINDPSLRCKVCRQDLDDPELRIFQGPPNDALEEEVALFDPKLSLFNGTEEDISYEDSRPSHKLTHFRCFEFELIVNSVLIRHTWRNSVILINSCVIFQCFRWIWTLVLFWWWSHWEKCIIICIRVYQASIWWESLTWR